MGNRESTPTGEEPVGDSQLLHYKQLFRDFTAPDHSGQPVDDKIFRVKSTAYRMICLLQATCTLIFICRIGSRTILVVLIWSWVICCSQSSLVAVRQWTSRHLRLPSPTSRHWRGRKVTSMKRKGSTSVCSPKERTQSTEKVGTVYREQGSERGRTREIEINLDLRELVKHSCSLIIVVHEQMNASTSMD